MKTVRRLLFRDIVGAVVFVTLAFLSLFFFIDPLSPLPHDVDVKALTRLAIVYDLPMASSPATAKGSSVRSPEKGGSPRTSWKRCSNARVSGAISSTAPGM